MSRSHAPGALALAAGVVLAVDDGGIAPATWCAGGLVIVALAVLLAITGRRPSSPRAVGVALAGAAVLCAFAYLSILWADVPADALAEAGKIGLYAIAVAIIVSSRWPAAAVRVALGIVAAGVTLIAVVIVARTAALDDPARMFVAGRLSDPIPYTNANAGLWLLGFWACFGLVVSAGLPRPARVASLGAACLLLELSLLSQSRGALIAIGVTAVLFVVAARTRLAILAQLALVGAAAALASTQLLDVRDAVGTGHLGAALSDARWAILLSVAGVTLVAGAGHAAIQGGADRRVAGLLPAAERRGPPVLAAVALVAALVAIGDPVSWAQDRWDDFRSGESPRVEAGATRFSGALGSDRDDYYRVAWHEFTRHPVAGIGAGNFQVAYLQRRKSIDAPRYPHSLPLQMLTQLGLVGGAAFAVFLLPLMLLATRAARVRGPDGPPVLAALAAFGVWAIHGLTDWLWEFPALSVIALGLLAVAARGGPESEPREPRRSRPLIAVAVPGLVLLVATFAVVGLAGKFAAEGRARSATDPRSAARWYARSARIDKLDADPLVEEAILDRRLHRPGHARRDLERALDREPDNWFAHLELAMLLGARGDRVGPRDHARARAAVYAAHRLNPGQIIVQEVRWLIVRHYRIDPLVVEAKLEHRPDRNPSAADR